MVSYMRRRRNPSKTKIGAISMKTNFLTRRKLQELQKALVRANKVLRIMRSSRIKMKSTLDVPALGLYLDLMN